MATLPDLLKMLVELQGSDLHITTGSAPQLRIDGRLAPLKTRPLTPPLPFRRGEGCQGPDQRAAI